MESLGGGGLSEIPFSKIESIKLFEETRSWSLCVWAFGFCPWLSEWESERHGVVKRRVNGVGEEKGEVSWQRICDFLFSFFLEKRWWKMTLPYIYIYIFIYILGTLYGHAWVSSLSSSLVPLMGLGSYGLLCSPYTLIGPQTSG